MRKKIFLVFALVILACNCINAQVMDSYLTSKGGKLYMGDTRLNKTSIANLDDFDLGLYKNGKAKFTGGVILVSAGALPTIIATYALVGSIIDAKTRNPEIPSGGLAETITIFMGIPALILEGIGIPLTCIGLKDIRTAVVNYNSNHNHSVQLSILPSTNCFYSDNALQSAVGVSLSLRF